MKQDRLAAAFGALAILVFASSCLGMQTPFPVAGRFRVVPIGGISAKLEQVKLRGNVPAVRVSFRKTTGERRLLALEASAALTLTDIRALAMDCVLRLTKGQVARLALVAYETDGGAWFKVGSRPVPVGAPTNVRLPLGEPTRAAFSRDNDSVIHWNQVNRVWVGLVIDGPAEGTWELRKVAFTDEPYRPDAPLRLTGNGPGTWSVGKDPAAQAKVSTPKEGPDGKPCLRFDFTFPGGRHMYALPTTSLPPVELEGYRALRFRFKATLPQGLNSLLVILHEQGGGQYYAQPPASADWTTIEIPFAQLKRASWARDADEKFDLEQVSKLTVGVHGTATKGGSGTIWATDLEFVP